MEVLDVADIMLGFTTLNEVRIALLPGLSPTVSRRSHH